MDLLMKKLVQGILVSIACEGRQRVTFGKNVRESGLALIEGVSQNVFVLGGVRFEAEGTHTVQ